MSSRYVNRKLMKKVTRLVPARLAELVRRKDSKAGPNCFSATIAFFDESHDLVFVSPNDMDKWLAENTDEDAYNRCAHGTIVTLYSVACDDDPAYAELIHTAVFVAPGVVFHKRGFGGRYEIVSDRDLHKMYPSDIQHYRIFKRDST